MSCRKPRRCCVIKTRICVVDSDANHDDVCGGVVRSAWWRDLLARGGIVVGCERWQGEELIEAAGELAFEAAQRAFGRLAFGFLAGEVLAGGGVVLGAGHGDDVQRVVELPVTAAVEPVPGPLP